MTTRKPSERTYLPALRGNIGDWIYYSGLMTLSDLAARVEYASLIHPSTKLSSRIQRTLDESTRAEEIAIYLSKNEDRFFNALVIAVYGGSPDWHQIDNIKPSANTKSRLGDIPDFARHSIGFLSLTGREKLFALDGQHRLAGIKQALAKSDDLKDEEVPVIFVAHKSNRPSDIRRTRKLFTTLNKTAKLVKKNEIIALDEADVMALSARYLIEDSSIFHKEQIEVSRKQANLPQGDRNFWMTIINLYDVLEILFRKGDRSAEMNQRLKYQRPSDSQLSRYFKLSEGYFKLLGKSFLPVRSLLSAQDPKTVLRKFRTSQGGHILFRPIGVLIFTEIVATLMKSGMTLPKAILIMSNLPTNLNEAPYKGTIWTHGLIDTRRRTLVRDILIYRLGRLSGGAKAVGKLEEKYAECLGKDVSDISLK